MEKVYVASRHLPLDAVVAPTNGVTGFKNDCAIIGAVPLVLTRDIKVLGADMAFERLYAGQRITLIERGNQTECSVVGVETPGSIRIDNGTAITADLVGRHEEAYGRVVAVCEGDDHGQRPWVEFDHGGVFYPSWHHSGTQYASYWGAR